MLTVRSEVFRRSLLMVIVVVLGVYFVYTVPVSPVRVDEPSLVTLSHVSENRDTKESNRPSRVCCGLSAPRTRDGQTRRQHKITETKRIETTTMDREQ